MTSFCGLPRLRIQRRRFGLATLKLLQKSGRSKFWGLLWELPPSSGHGFSRRLNTIGCFLTASWPFKICSLRGSSSSSVPPLTSGFATQSSPLLSPHSTTSRCGTRFSVTLHPSHHGSWPVFRCTWGDGVFAVRPALPARHIGVVGLIVSTLWLNVMRTSPARWQRLSVLRQLTQSTSEEQWQAVASLPRLGTTVQTGRLYLKERALGNRTLVRWILGCPLMGGSSSQPRPWSNVTEPLSCGRVFPRPNKPSSARNRAHVGVALLFCSLFAPHSVRSSALPRLASSSPLACPPSLFSHLPVWPSTPRPWPPPCSVFESGSLGESVVLLGERSGTGLQPELGSPPISSSGNRTFPLPSMTPVVWRSLRTGFRCSAEPNWPSIPR